MIELLRKNIRVVAIIAVVILLLVVNIVLLLQWQSAGDAQAKVEDDWKRADTNLRITRVQYEMDTLQAQKNELSAKPQFPSALPVVDLMLYVANGAALFPPVNIIEVNPATRVDTEVIGGKGYRAYRTQVTVTGTLSKIISFLEYIERSPFNSIKIEDVSLSGSADSWQCKFTIAVITQ